MPNRATAFARGVECVADGAIGTLFS